MAEKNYGMIHDDVSWARDPDETRVVTVSSCQVFDAAPEVEPAGPHVLARTSSLAAYMRTFADGAGENGLHSHDDDGIWLVLAGRAEFHTADNVLLGTADAGGGVLVPAGTPYRFVCHGRSTLLRIAART